MSETVSNIIIQKSVVAIVFILLILSIFVLNGKSMQWYNVIVNGLVPFGDILTRTQFLNGSTSEFFTLLPIFQLPIAGLIPAFMAKSGSLGKGKMKHLGYDMFVILSILIKYMSSSMSQKYVFPNKLFIRMFGTFVAIYFPIMIRIFSPRNELCEKYKASKLTIFAKSIGQAGTIQLIITVLTYGLQYLPYIGPYFKSLYEVPVVGDTLAFTVFFLPLYTLLNMNNENNVKNYCRNKNDAIIFFIVGFIGIFISGGLSKVIEFSKKQEAPVV